MGNFLILLSSAARPRLPNHTLNWSCAHKSTNLKMATQLSQKLVHQKIRVTNAATRAHFVHALATNRLTPPHGHFGARKARRIHKVTSEAGNEESESARAKNDLTFGRALLLCSKAPFKMAKNRFSMMKYPTAHEQQQHQRRCVCMRYCHCNQARRFSAHSKCAMQLAAQSYTSDAVGT